LYLLVQIPTYIWMQRTHYYTFCRCFRARYIQKLVPMKYPFNVPGHYSAKPKANIFPQ